MDYDRPRLGEQDSAKLDIQMAASDWLNQVRPRLGGQDSAKLDIQIAAYDWMNP